MVGGTIHREVIHGEISRVLVLHPALATTRCAKHCRAELRLDNAFVLIEGHPPAKNRLGERRYLLMAALRFLNTLAGSFDNIERLTGHLAFDRFHVGLRHFHGRDARGGVHL